ncbi:MAG: hypothetical protein Q7S48_03065 [bacterium]|nr:hypothetical protein [bacterium]
MKQEELQYLEDWLKNSKELAEKVRSCADKEGGRAIFTISTTTKIPDHQQPYLTPFRQITHGFIGGVVVFSQIQAILACRKVDGIVDWILVDAEKKLPVTLGFDQEVFEHFKLDPPTFKNKSRIHVEMGNLSAACQSYVSKSEFQEFKPNDLTVDAVWHQLSQTLGVLSGKKVAIIGSGNIGFKLGMKLVESGSNVELVRRNVSRGVLMADVINTVKPISTMARANYNADPLQASLFCDAIIGCANGVPVINWDMMQVMKPDGIVIDVGKGTIFPEAVLKGVEHGIKMTRCDVSSGIDGLIAIMERTKTVMKRELGRRKMGEGIYVVSGGYLGLDGDIVVDNFMNPRHVIGISNGTGDWKKDLSEENRRALKEANLYIQKNTLSSASTGS